MTWMVASSLVGARARTAAVEAAVAASRAGVWVAPEPLRGSAATPGAARGLISRRTPKAATNSSAMTSSPRSSSRSVAVFGMLFRMLGHRLDLHVSGANENHGGPYRAAGRIQARHTRSPARSGLHPQTRAATSLAHQGGIRSHGARPAPGSHGAAEQDAPVPAAGARGHLPDRGFHRNDRGSHRPQRDAPAAHARGSAGQRTDLPGPGVQDPGSA